MKQIRINRPLVVFFFLVMLGIVIWNRFRDNFWEAWKQKAFTCSGVVETIQRTASGTKVLTLSKVEPQYTKTDKTSSLRKILLYETSDQKSEQQLFSHIQIGNEIQVTGEAESFERAGNPGQFDAFSYYEAMQVDARMFVSDIQICNASCNPVKQLLYEWRNKAMQQLVTAMGERDAGLLGAMLLGDKSQLDSEIKELYQQTGVAHMLAISGLHISLLGMVLFDWLRKYLLPMKTAAIVSLVLLLLYGQFTGFPVATSRAVWMLCIRLVARYTGKPYDGLTALAISGCVILLQNPLQLFQCGFVLSFVAAGGILIYQEMTSKRQKQMKEWQKTLLSTVWTFFLTLPVMFWYFYEICPYAVIANLVLLPFLSALLGIGILGCVLCFIIPPAGGFILASAHGILAFYELVCKGIKVLPGNTLIMGQPEIWKIIIYYVFLLLSVYVWAMHGDKIKTVFSVAALCLVLGSFRPAFEFLYIQMDVGQGDCACIFNGEQTYLIDGGSTSEKEIGKYRIAKMLKYYGRDEVDGVFITHGDEDHVNGIEELAERQEKEGITICQIIVPNLQRKEEGLQKFVQTVTAKKIPVASMRKGQQITSGNMQLRCLHPASEYEWEDANDCSLVFDLSYKNLSILTTGDLGVHGEENSTFPRKRYDILKVGHHGSKNSSSEVFLQKCRPRYGFISAGADNRYGHPAKETLQRLENISCKNWNTAQKGALFAEYKKGQKRCWYFKH